MLTKKVSFSALALIVMGGGGSFWYVNQSNNPRQSTNQPTVIKNQPQNQDYSPDLTDNLELQSQYEKIGPPSKITAMPCANYDKRPFAIMLTGDRHSRKYFSNLSLADIVVEMPHRPMHGQPRLMGVYQCNLPQIVGPMRSGRTDHISVADSFDAIYVPWGGSSVGKSLLKQRLVDHIDCNGEVYPGGNNACFRRNDPKSSAMNKMEKASTNLIELIKRAEEVGYRKKTNIKGYQHQNDLSLDQRPAKGVVKINFEKPNQVYYNYNRENNSYLRFIEDDPDLDFETGKQYSPKNLIIIPAKKEAWSTSIDYVAQGLKNPWEGIDSKHLINDNGQYPNMQLGDPWFDTTFSGIAYFYFNGKEIVGTWTREKGMSKQFDFFDKNGDPIKFVPGQIWIHIIEDTQTIEFVPSQ